MKPVGILLTYLLLLAGYVAVERSFAVASTTAPAPWSVKISGPVTLHSGQVITIDIVLTNISSEPLWVVGGLGSDAERIMDIEVRMQDGKKVRKTRYGRAMLDGERNEYHTVPTSLGGIKLAPDESRLTGSILSDVYDMTLPGTYIIKVQYDSIASNEITVTVTP